MNNITEKLYNHWFYPEDFSKLNITIILVVCLQLFLLLVPSSFTYQISPGSMREVQEWLTTIPGNEYEPVWILKILLIPFGWDVRPDLFFLEVTRVLAIISGFLVLAGIFIRGSLVFFTVTNTILIAHFYSYNAIHHPEALIIIFLWILAFVPESLKGNLTFSRRFVNKEKSKNIGWTFRLMQWFLVIIYFSAGWEKIKYNFDWLNGYTLSYWLGLGSINIGSTIGQWFASNLTIMVIISVVVILFELSFFLVMFIPRITWIYLSFGILFHLGIYILQGPNFLHYIILYIVFPEPVMKFVNKELIPAKL